MATREAGVRTAESATQKIRPSRPLNIAHIKPSASPLFAPLPHHISFSVSRSRSPSLPLYLSIHLYISFLWFLVCRFCAGRETGVNNDRLLAILKNKKRQKSGELRRSTRRLAKRTCAWWWVRTTPSTARPRTTPTVPSPACP